MKLKLLTLTSIFLALFIFSCGDSGFVIEEEQSEGADARVDGSGKHTGDGVDPNSVDPDEGTNRGIDDYGKKGKGDYDGKNYIDMGSGDLMDPDVDVKLPDDLSPDEQLSIKRCLLKWGYHPFGTDIKYVKKISASVSVGGIGNAVNDTVTTKDPVLTLIIAGVNVLGETTYNLRNDNGYYCIQTNVNVLTTLNMNLACHARVADNSVNVNIGSYIDDANTSGIGVHVGSAINVNRLTASGSACGAQ